MDGTTVEIRNWSVCGKSTVSNRQLVNAHKELMCFDGTAVGLTLPEDGVNKELMCFDGTAVGLTLPEDGVNKRRNP